MMTIYHISFLLLILYLLFIFSFKKNNQCKISYENPEIFIKNEHMEEFKKNNIVLINNVFNPLYFYKLKAAVLDNCKKSKRQNRLEFLRKASTVKASDIISSISDLYYSVYFLKVIRKISGFDLQNVNCDDESSMNIFTYDEPEDFITWHKDPNHYNGNRLTVLINIVNENSNNSDLSDSELHYIVNGKQEFIKMSPNSMLIFNGSKINHMATGVKQGESRIILSFTYCDLCEESFTGYIVKTIKNKVLGY